MQRIHGQVLRSAVAALVLFFLACADATVPVEREPVAQVRVTAPASEINVGATLQLSATPLGQSGAPLSGRALEWASSDSAVAQVSGSGMVTARAAGSATIRAISEGRDGSVSLLVRPVRAVVAAVVIRPQDEVSLFTGGTFQLRASAVAANDSVLDDRVVTWSSGNTTVATVDQSGLVKAVAAGTAVLTATSEGRFARATITVHAIPVARLEPTTGGVVTLLTDESTQLGVRAFAADGTELFGRQVTWSSENSSIATVSATGLVKAQGVGSADVTARVDEVTAKIAIDVRSRIVRIDVNPGRLTFGVGQDSLFTATLRGEGGVVLQRPITWTTSNPTIATVDATGRVFAHAAGDVTIKAIAEGQEGWSYVQVEPWLQRPLELVGDSALPTTLMRYTTTTPTGTRNVQVIAYSGHYRNFGVMQGEYELRFSVAVIAEGQGTQFGQLGYGGTHRYDSAAGGFVLQSWNGSTLIARLLPDGRLQIKGRLEPNTPEVTLTFRPL